MADSMGKRKKRLTWNKEVSKDMAAEMATKGHVYSANEIRVKIHNLTNKYRDERKSIGPSGGSPSTWEFYPKINSIFGSYKSFNLETLMEESTVHEVVDCASPLTLDSQEELPFVDEEPARKRKNIFQTKIFKMNFWRNSGLQIKELRRKLKQFNRMAGRPLKLKEKEMTSSKNSWKHLRKACNNISLKT
ncbi:PREDICTED: uncharacterized protein LOC108972698 [Bactrocera latifrons]|uniref:Myb/SANT-like DNA-binding domain-containing protein n=1 Tax=Bactrocera latifrons TaxID=174628 RepID=A0A0K8VVZ7_BACLA|nr:PREDICTED: uncharacterized protein LOC108972698 [Bactrocera latifrons]